MVTVVVFPAPSVATISIVFVPILKLTVVENEPFAFTVTLFPFTVNVTGLDVISFVVPETVTVFTFVLKSSDGAVTFKTGGTVSIEIEIEVVASFPSLSEHSNVNVCVPSSNAVVGI